MRQAIEQQTFAEESGESPLQRSLTLDNRSDSMAQIFRVPPLKPSTQWTMDEVAADSLGRIGAAAVPELTPLLQDPNAELRLSAIQVLARIGPDAALAVPDLARLLGDDDPRVARAAATALGQIGPNAAAAVPGLIEHLQDVE